MTDTALDPDVVTRDRICLDGSREWSIRDTAWDVTNEPHRLRVIADCDGVDIEHVRVTSHSETAEQLSAKNSGVAIMCSQIDWLIETLAKARDEVLAQRAALANEPPASEVA